MLESFSRVITGLDIRTTCNKQVNIMSSDLYISIAKQLSTLGDTFYDGMPNNILSHPHIRGFANHMISISNDILEQVKKHDSSKSCDSKMQDIDFINTSQLQRLADSPK
jgi:hypothetical protein